MDDAQQDRRFFDTFMLVLGALFAITVVIYFVAVALAESNLDVENKEEAAAQAALAERIEPVGRVATAEQPAVQATPPVVAAAAGAAAAQAETKPDGKQVYSTACMVCHGAGVAGAPKLGDKGAWAPRIKQGMATLNEHALKGFTGKAGVMPAKGGRSDLSDAHIVAAVEYMVSQGK